MSNDLNINQQQTTKNKLSFKTQSSAFIGVESVHESMDLLVGFCGFLPSPYPQKFIPTFHIHPLPLHHDISRSILSVLILFKLSVKINHHFFSIEDHPWSFQSPAPIIYFLSLQRQIQFFFLYNGCQPQLLWNIRVYFGLWNSRSQFIDILKNKHEIFPSNSSQLVLNFFISGSLRNLCFGLIKQIALIKFILRYLNITNS